MKDLKVSPEWEFLNYSIFKMFMEKLDFSLL